MNRTTQEVMNSINILIKFADNIPLLKKEFPDVLDDIELIEGYVSYQVRKTLKDITHLERL